jgi:hypothetical protein
MQVASVISIQNSTESQLKYKLYAYENVQTKIAVTSAYRGDVPSSTHVYLSGRHPYTVFCGCGTSSYTVSVTKVMYIVWPCHKSGG